jgi:hypothetical protein
MDPYENLANAIVLQAVKDYRETLKMLAQHPYNKKALSIREEVEGFFRSGWFSALTELDPEMLIENLKAEVA